MKSRVRCPVPLKAAARRRLAAGQRLEQQALTGPDGPTRAP